MTICIFVGTFHFYCLALFHIAGSLNAIKTKNTQSI